MAVVPIVALLVLGLALFVFGLVGRRIGDEPRCRKCGYNLTAIEAGNCPECGRLLTGPHAVRAGVRRRRRIPLVLGIVVVALAAGPWAPRLYTRLAGFNPYRLQPYSWVLAAAQDGAPRAIDELIRRVQAKCVKDPEVAQLADVALKAQADAAKSPRTKPPPRLTLAQLRWTDLLAALELAEQLSDAQRLQFLRQCQQVDVRARTPVRQGDLVPIHAYLQTMGTTLFSLVTSMRIVEARIGEEVTPGGSTCTADLGVTGQMICGSSVRIAEDATGMAVVEVRIVFSIYHDWDEVHAKAAPIVTWEERPQVEVEILPKDAPDPVQAVADESLRPRLAACLQMRSATAVHTAGDSKVAVNVMLDNSCPGGLPTDVAFDVYLITTNGAHKLQSYSATSRSSGSQGVFGAAPAFDDAEVSFELRASAEVARETVDINTFWDGTLSIGPIPVTHIPPVAPAATAAPGATPSPGPGN